jgi:hypothetical protein
MEFLMSKNIRLTQGKVAIVDDADYDWLNQWKWNADQVYNTWYAKRHSHRTAGRNIQITMHRVILGLKPNDRQHTDHIDGNGLNNQRNNLRVCTHQQNMQNRKPRRGRTTKFKGISQEKKTKRWRAEITVDGNKTFLGCFATEVAAAKKYDEAALKYQGEFARLNFPIVINPLSTTEGRSSPKVAVPYNFRGR